MYICIIMYTQNALYDYIFYIDSILDILKYICIYIYIHHIYHTCYYIYTMYTVSIYRILIYNYTIYHYM